MKIISGIMITLVLLALIIFIGAATYRIIADADDDCNCPEYQREVVTEDGTTLPVPGISILEEEDHENINDDTRTNIR